VNNAGIAPSGFLDWLSLASYRRTMEVNFFAIVNITKLFLPLLKKCKNSRKYFINGRARRIPNGTAYCGKKDYDTSVASLVIPCSLFLLSFSLYRQTEEKKFLFPFG
jgi:NADP-dependent 3-hydroxy acid dehydrogenase YdfG